MQLLQVKQLISCFR